MDVIDLRSDTVTLPTEAMLAAMRSAPVGDDVYAEDPSVQALQQRLSHELGFEAGLFVPSGTQSNLLALFAHCERGDEYIVGMESHAYKWEGGGAAVLGSIQPQPLPQDATGCLALDAVAAAVKPIDPHFARTRLLVLENTWNGRALPLDYLQSAHDVARAHGLGLHLDGARLFNAAMASEVPARQIARYFDTVSVCLSKGLGAPVGSVLLGSRVLLEKAKRWRKVLGGGWRQAGGLAAAGMYALDHHVQRLAEDHARAARLAAGLAQLPGLTAVEQHTNMVFAELPLERQRMLASHLAVYGIKIGVGYLPSLRLVTHLGIDDAAVEHCLLAFAEFFKAV